MILSTVPPLRAGHSEVREWLTCSLWKRSFGAIFAPTFVTTRRLVLNPLLVPSRVKNRRPVLNPIVVRIVLTIRELVLNPICVPTVVTIFVAHHRLVLDPTVIPTYHLVLVTLLSSSQSDNTHTTHPPND